jgi:hypothetical protein
MRTFVILLAAVTLVGVGVVNAGQQHKDNPTHHVSQHKDNPTHHGKH